MALYIFAWHLFAWNLVSDIPVIFQISISIITFALIKYGEPPRRMLWRWRGPLHPAAPQCSAHWAEQEGCHTLLCWALQTGSDTAEQHIAWNGADKHSYCLFCPVSFLIQGFGPVCRHLYKFFLVCVVVVSLVLFWFLVCLFCLCFCFLGVFLV